MSPRRARHPVEFVRREQLSLGDSRRSSEGASWSWEAVIWIEPLLAAGGVLVADQASKAFVIARRAVSPSGKHFGFFSIQPLLNTHLMLPGSAWFMLLFLWALCLALSVLTLSHGPFEQNALGAVGIGITIGGATGNLVDRLRRGAIVDFIAIGRWPVFNLADAAIFSGLALALISLR